MFCSVGAGGGGPSPIRVSISYRAPDLFVNSEESGNNKRIYLPGLYEHEYNYLFRGSSQPSDGEENL